MIRSKREAKSQKEGNKRHPNNNQNKSKQHTQPSLEHQIWTRPADESPERRDFGASFKESQRTMEAEPMLDTAGRESPIKVLNTFTQESDHYILKNVFSDDQLVQGGNKSKEDEAGLQHKSLISNPSQIAQEAYPD